MYLIAGLGNPGRDYVNTRHNVGFEAVSVLSSFYEIPLKKIKHKALFGEGKIGGEQVILAQPQTFMNNSGESIREIMDYYKIPITNLIVIYDEVALPAGKIRIKPSGSAGGHNGMKSIVNILANENFPRIRVGIGRPNYEGDLVNFVIGAIDEEDKEELEKGKEVAKNALIEILKNGIESAMNKFN